MMVMRLQNFPVETDRSISPEAMRNVYHLERALQALSYIWYSVTSL